MFSLLCKSVNMCYLSLNGVERGRQVKALLYACRVKIPFGKIIPSYRASFKQAGK